MKYVILADIRTDLENLQRNKSNKLVQELHEIIKNVDLSVLDRSDIVCPSTPKRRKTSRAGFESNGEHYSEKLQKAVDEIESQVKLVKMALNLIYEAENETYRKFISKNGNKSRNVVSRVNFIERIQENGERIPLWLGIGNETPPALCGAIEADDGYVAETGDMVAALIKQNKKENWILAEVIAYDIFKKEYIVDDVYEETKAEQTLNYNKVIPLPKFKADPEINPEAIFSKDFSVLALYPGTTCFYRAIVFKPPEKAEDPYQLLFEDENYESGYSSAIPVFQRFVVNYGCYVCEEESSL